jgi:hypothetical protein
MKGAPLFIRHKVFSIAAPAEVRAMFSADILGGQVPHKMTSVISQG